MEASAMVVGGAARDSVCIDRRLCVAVRQPPGRDVGRRRARVGNWSDVSVERRAAAGESGAHAECGGESIAGADEIGAQGGRADAGGAADSGEESEAAEKIECTGKAAASAATGQYGSLRRRRAGERPVHGFQRAKYAGRAEFWREWRVWEAIWMVCRYCPPQGFGELAEV